MTTTTTLSLSLGFGLLLVAGVLACGSSAEPAFKEAAGLPVHVSGILFAALAITLFGSVGVGSNLVPIKAQAGDRIHEPLTYRPGFVSFNHRVVPGTD